MVPPTQQGSYASPFRDAHVSPSRIDMGVDYAGSGPIHALGPGYITEADSAWAGAIGAPYPGTYIVEKMTDGPLAGLSIYTAEDVTPNVRVGDRVDSTSVIGQFTGGGLLETGYSYGTGGTTMAAHTGQSAAGNAMGDPGHFSTAYGEAFNNVLTSVGPPSGSTNPPLQRTCPCPF